VMPRNRHLSGGEAFDTLLWTGGALGAGVAPPRDRGDRERKPPQ
jgi:hypothetical protein